MTPMAHCYVEKLPRESHETPHTILYALCRGPAEPMQAGFSRRTVPTSWADETEIRCPECNIARLIARVNGLGSTDTKALFELLAASLSSALSSGSLEAALRRSPDTEESNPISQGTESTHPR